MGKIRFNKSIAWKGLGCFDAVYDKESQVQQLTIFCYNKKGLTDWMKRLSAYEDRMSFVLTIGPIKTRRNK